MRKIHVDLTTTENVGHTPFNVQCLRQIDVIVYLNFRQKNLIKVGGSGIGLL